MANMALKGVKNYKIVWLRGGEVVKVSVQIYSFRRARKLANKLNKIYRARNSNVTAEPRKIEGDE